MNLNHYQAVQDLLAQKVYENEIDVATVRERCKLSTSRPLGNRYKWTGCGVDSAVIESRLRLCEG